MVLRKPGKPLPDDSRLREIEKVCSGFVAPGPANRQIYRAVLECVLPPGSGLPGPVVTRDDLRHAVEAIKPGYKDVFRRVRELQGEEGLTGLVKWGSKYQLQHLAIESKREPRKAISSAVARKIALKQGSRCTVCGAALELDGKIDVDHRVPRKRQGTSFEGNLQVLCRACNINKSTQCSGCELPCETCGWAFPEKYRPVKLSPSIILRVNALARDTNRPADDVANELLDRALREDHQR
ncbi:MAG: HNH endonuclease signature motif containing protein [Gemmatimonadetes bacterium]|nr:HNH endonuclease signature motif containing protein [Gemmatimonadota bacterium]MXX71149.1 HNH endonuclease [Gemmatimonadota bacterium]MYG36130.1 HNH endonuclease [Gemmatimonadota bacterium]